MALPGCGNQGVWTPGQTCASSPRIFCHQTTGMDLQCTHAKGAMHPEVKTCATAMFDAEVDVKRTRMLAAVAPRQVLPYPAIVGRNAPGYMFSGTSK